MVIMSFRYLAFLIWLSVGLSALGAGIQPPALPSTAPQWGRSPVSSFRKWLALPPVERPEALGSRSDEQKHRLLEKLAEYDAMPPEQREDKLRMVEFDWYVRSLLRTTAADRAESLLTLPKEWLKPVQERLRQWDQLPEDLQKELLSSELLIRIFVHGQNLSPKDEEAALKQLPPAVRLRWEAQLEKWRTTTGPDRAKAAASFQPFFAMSASEQKRALQAMNDSDRREMEATLEAFSRLPKEERAKCVEAFGHFAGMNNDERRQFLMNAGRWQSMTPQERKLWRGLLQAFPSSPSQQNLPPFPPPVFPSGRRTASTNSP